MRKTQSDIALDIMHAQANRFTKIDPKTYEGTIPPGHEFIITEEGDTSFDGAIVMLGFDEIGEFDDQYENPVYGFLKFRDSLKGLHSM